MKYSMVFKFLALLLCACCLLVSVGAAAGILALVETDLYNSTVDDLRAQNYDSRMHAIAEDIVQSYVMRNLSNLPEEAARHYGYPYDAMDWDNVYYHLYDGDGKLLAEHIDQNFTKNVQTYQVSVYGIRYPTVLAHRLLDAFTGLEIDTTQPPTMNTVPMHTEAEEQTDPLADWVSDTVAPGEGEYQYFENWGYEDQDGFHQYRLGIRYVGNYQVMLYLTEGVYQENDHWIWEVAEFGYANRYNVIWVLGASLLLFAALFVYLCCAAGRKPKCEEACPGGLNRLPLDLYGVGVGLAVMCLAVLGWDLLRYSFDYFDPQWLLVLAVGVMAYVACLLVVGFFFACAAQFKMKQFYWAKHSVTGMVLAVVFKLSCEILRKLRSGGKWLFDKLPPAGKKLVGLGKKAYQVLKDILVALWELFVKVWKAFWSLVGRLLRFIWDTVQRFSLLLPLTWQWLLVGFGLIFALLFSFGTRNTGIQFLGIAVCICIIMYGAHCFGVLLESTKRMSKGDLDTKVDDKLLLGGFKEYAAELNALADVAVEAAKQQMKSERMKAELVTNVSHDIKTPLTNIINYVDLLKKAQTQEQAEQYLEVLDRQSQRLKKLIEDLMEMSKASTGNMNVDLMAVNAVEAINQALGEFSEKLEKAQLTPVFNPPEEPVMMTADGRLTWRVLSNLLGNAVKYALPGTRLYIDLVEMNGQVLISLKNISAEQLNVSTDELMERFVRGDASRNTEGSGLGLNIARSLMELQKGQLQLLVDGDLFKATLIFPQK